MYVSEITGRSYSKADFLEMLEKRIRKHNRLHLDIDLNKRYAKGPGKADKYLVHVLQRIYGKRIHFDGEWKLSSETLDDWVGQHLSSILAGKTPDFDGIMRPLQVISTTELLQACELLEIKGEEPATPHQFIQKLQEIYPQTKSSFLKSFLHIEESTKNKEENS